MTTPHQEAMRLAIISDIHGNLEAFESVTADITAAGVDKTISLGDNIGYGAESDAVLRRIRDAEIPSVLGNHELAVMDPAVLAWFNPLARQSIEYTASRLSDASLRCLRAFPKSTQLGDCWFVHGFPPDSETRYLFQADDAEVIAGLDATGCPICFIGHTHDLEIVTIQGDSVVRDALAFEKRTLNKAERYLLNIGSVGQPRDGNRDAKYAIFDTDTWVIEIRAVAYDREKAAQKIIAAGLPANHANRLR
jgi:predicted phosphodiesterase